MCPPSLRRDDLGKSVSRSTSSVTLLAKYVRWMTDFVIIDLLAA
jgi:hypothetical protein